MKFTIYGEPIAKGRPKIFSRGGFAGAYTPKATRQAEENLRAQIVQQLQQLSPNHAPFDCPLIISLSFFRSRPKSAQKRHYPTTKPDLDNLAKLALDAMNGVVYRDDALIFEMTLQKKYSDTPRIEIEVLTCASPRPMV